MTDRSQSVRETSARLIIVMCTGVVAGALLGEGLVVGLILGRVSCWAW